MKNLIRALIAALALSPAVGLCALVQAVGFQNAQTTAAVTQTIASTTAGDALILGCSNYIDTKHPTSFVSGSSTSSTADKTYTDSTDNYFFSIWSIPNISGGLTSITVNMSAAAFMTCIVIEESGLATSSMLDQISAGNQQAGVTSWSSTAVTTTNASDIAFGFAYIPADGITFTAGTSWTMLSGTGLTNGSVSETTNNTQQLFGERMALSSTGPYQATGGGPNSTYTSMIATYKAAGGGGHPPPQVTVIPP